MSVLSILAQSSYYSDSYYTSTGDSAAVAAVGAGLVIFTLLVSVIGYVVYAFFLSRIFKKAGVEGWIAWVPIYNNWKLLEIGGQQGFWAVLALIPIVNIASAIFMIIAMYNIGLKLGKEGIFVLLAIFLPIVWIIWLALDSSKWDDSKGAPSLVPTRDPQDPTQPTPPQTPPATPIV